MEDTDRDGFRSSRDYRVLRAKLELRRTPESRSDPALLFALLEARRPGYRAEQRSLHRTSTGHPLTVALPASFGQ